MSGRIDTVTGNFVEGDSDDDGYSDTEVLQLHHKRGFGYNELGAQENDYILNRDGKKPMEFDKSRRQSMGGRIEHFNRGVIGGIVG
jgi:hypothetical protein